MVVVVLNTSEVVTTPTIPETRRWAELSGDHTNRQTHQTLLASDQHPSSFLCFSRMGKEVVMVEDIPFQPEVATAGGKTLELLGHGITDMEIHFLQIKFTAIGVYLDKDATVECLAKWKGGKPTTEAELAGDELFYDAIIASPSEKVLRVVVIKEIKGSQYGVQLESSVRDRLAADDKYEEEEELELEKLTQFFQSKYFKKGTDIVFAFHPPTKSAEVTLVIEGKQESKMKLGNANVVEMIQRWYLGGDRSVSPSTVKSLTATLAGILSQ